jgi:ABC transporter substrate binding protein
MNIFRNSAVNITVLVLTSLLFVSSCAVQKETRPAAEKKAPIPKPVQPKTAKPAKPAKPIALPDVTIMPSVAIVLSTKAVAYRDIADQLKIALKKRAEVFTLSGEEHYDATIIRTIQSSDHQQVVAIGLRAARTASILKDKQVIFAQVFNYQEHHLITDSMKGVSSLPPPEKLFKDWKTLSPNLRRVVVISGENLTDYIKRAKKAAKKNNIDLLHKTVHNDKEFVYTAKHLPGVVQGHWLLPDNRVLSRKALKEIMAYNSKEGRQTVVFAPKLLSFGGLFYITPSRIEISQLVLKRLEYSIGEKNIPGEGVLPLMNYTIGINPRIASQHGLGIPDNLQEFVYEQ